MNQHRSLEVPPQRVALTVDNVALLHREGAFDGYGKVELMRPMAMEPCREAASRC